MDENDITTFQSAAQTHSLPPSIQITYHNSRLDDLPPSTTFDAIVSPANSYARMDGGFDHALSQAFSPQNNYMALTRVAQAALYKEYRGFLPPGACLLVNLQDKQELNSLWGCKYLALCPTMRVPHEVTWDREVVYECIWSLLAAVDRHNRRVREQGGEREEEEIKSLLMTPLATGCGLWSTKKWAAQTVIAIRHFVEAMENEGKWKVMGPVRIMAHAVEVERTFEL